MPVPKPSKNEKKEKFISRCISDLEKKDTKRKKEQIQAMCFSQWKRSKQGEAMERNKE